MNDSSRSGAAKYILVGSIGAFAGGILVLAVSKVIPKMVSGMIEAMMTNMMATMGGEGCSPADL